MKISNPTAKRYHDDWWSRISREGDPAHRAHLVTEAFVAGWNAGIAKAERIANIHPHLPDASPDCLDAQGCCEAIAGTIGEQVEREWRRVPSLPDDRISRELPDRDPSFTF